MKKALVVVVLVLILLVLFMRLCDVKKFIEAMNWIKVMQTTEQPIGKFCFSILKTFQLINSPFHVSSSVI